MRRALAVVHDYPSLIAVLRRRAEQLDISNATLDGATGLADGYVGGVLAMNGKRTLGKLSLGLLLSAMGLRLVVVEDREALKRVRPLLERRKHNGKHRQLGPAGGEPPLPVR
jgi:hypothetical protein